MVQDISTKIGPLGDVLRTLCARWEVPTIKHGIHNFDDKLFLGNNISLYLRVHIQNHISVTSFVNSHNNMFDCNLNHQKVLNGYKLSNALCQSDKTFYCYVCGHHCWTLVIDLSWKIAFKMFANEVNIDNKSDEVIDLDEVNMDKIWEKVELNVTVKAFSQVKIKSLSST